MIRVLALAVIASACLLATSAAQARTAAGDLIWRDQFDLAGRGDGATVVAAGDGRIVAVGTAEDSIGHFILVVRAYNARTGELLWQDRLEMSGGSVFPVAVEIDGPRAVVAAGGFDERDQSQTVLRTYAAATGVTIWEDRWPVLAGGLAVVHNRIVVAGSVLEVGGGRTSAVRAYAVKTGAVDWEASPLPPPGFISESSPRVALRGKNAFVSTAAFDGQNSVCLVRSFDLKNGALLWEASHSEGRDCFAASIAADGRAVVLSGNGSSSNPEELPGNVFVTMAFDAKTGILLWSDRAPGTPDRDIAISVDIERRLTFALGWNYQGSDAMLLRAYDTRTGKLRWEDRYLAPIGCSCHGIRLVAQGGRVFAFGKAVFLKDGALLETWVVSAYDAKSGDILWRDDGGSTSNPLGSRSGSVALDDGRLFVVSSERDASGNEDFVVRAYDAK